MLSVSSTNTMKHYSPDKILILSLTIAILTIFIVEFVFDDVTEIFDGGARLGEIAVGMGLSFVAAYFFYIVTFLVPRKVERKHIEEHAAHLINRVLFHILFIMQDAVNSNVSQKDLKLLNLTERDFKLATTNVFMDNDLKNFRVGADGHNISVGEAVIKHVNDLKLNIDELFKYSSLLEPELVSHIGSATRNLLNESWPNRFEMGPIYVGSEVMTPARTDISGYAKHLYEYHLVYKSIENIFLKKYSDADAAKKHAKNIDDLQKS
jgi:hypothetical protein